MCGICGLAGRPLDDIQLRAATNVMIRRGPDEAGYFHEGDIALGVRRLRVIDLAGGSQPKTDESGRIHVILNGEIYNYRELRAELRVLGHDFASQSDTEVTAHAYEEWGTGAFTRFNGIFAIAIWDDRARVLNLARDHLGVKPLYYCAGHHSLAFASELKSLMALLPDMPAIDPRALGNYLQLGYVPHSQSILKGVSKLPPAHYLAFDSVRGGHSVKRYWDPLVAVRRKRETLTVQDAENLVDSALTAAVRRQLVSDVPVGAFLSGGIDSSAIVAVMQRETNVPIRTFSIGFSHPEYDECRFAARVAQYLSTDHTNWTVSPADALATLPDLPHFLDEPLADPSAIPTFLVSQLARQHVTVSLSGDGGDELFGGYERYNAFRRSAAWWHVPAGVRRAAISGAGRAPGSIGRAAQRRRDTLGASTRSDAYRNIVGMMKDSTASSLGATHVPGAESARYWPKELFDEFAPGEAIMLTDLITYLPGNILAKVDRSSMAHSLEVRVPLLDLELVELVLSLPVELRWRAGPKTVLKSVLRRYIPSELTDRPKQGFGLPLGSWLRGALRPYLLDYLSPDSVAAHGLLAPEHVARLLDEHLSGRANREQELWTLVVFQAWYEEVYTKRAGLRTSSPDSARHSQCE